MPSRKIEDCHPTLQPLQREFLARCTRAGMNILVTCTYGSSAEQDALYAQVRTKPGARVTNAKGGQSRHNDAYEGRPGSTAFDIVPLDGAGKAIWDATIRTGAWQVESARASDWSGAEHGKRCRTGRTSG